MAGLEAKSCPVWPIGVLIISDESGRKLKDAKMWRVYENDSILCEKYSRNYKPDADSIFKFFSRGYISGQNKGIKYYRIQCEGYSDVVVRAFNFNFHSLERGRKLPVLNIVLYKMKFIQKDGYFIKFDQYELEEAKATSDSTVINIEHYTKKLKQEATQATYDRIMRSNYLTYPNPVQDKMTIEIKDSMPHPFKVKVFDLSGKVVFEEELTETLTKIDLTAIAAGTYFVRIEDHKGEMRHCMKFVKT